MQMQRNAKIASLLSSLRQEIYTAAAAIIVITTTTIVIILQEILRTAQMRSVPCLVWQNYMSISYSVERSVCRLA